MKFSIDSYIDAINEGVLKQMRYPHKANLAKWLDIARGPLSMVEFSKETKLNKVFLSRLKNGKIDRPLRIEEIYSIACYNHADEKTVRKSFTFENDDVEDMDSGDMIIREMIFNNGMEWMSNDSQKNQEQEAHYGKIYRLFAAIANSLLVTGRKIRYIRVDRDDDLPEEERKRIRNIQKEMYGAVYYVSDTAPQYHWYGGSVEYLSIPHETKIYFRNLISYDEIVEKYDKAILEKVESFMGRNAYVFLVDLLDPKLLEIATYSFIFEDPVLVDAIYDVLGKYSFNNTFSLIVIDTEKRNGSVVKERFLNRIDGMLPVSLFSCDDRSREESRFW